MSHNCKKGLFSQKGMTLVELIVVITILAILGTLGFVSIWNFQSTSRDSVRVSDVVNIRKSLELFALKTAKFPRPDGVVSSGSINGNALTYVGKVGDTISSIIWTSKTFKDPISNTQYAYGITSDGNIIHFV